MTDESQPKAERAATNPDSAVLNADWEASLRRGRDEDAGEEVAGSIEPELAYVHLLRHARAPEPMGDLALESVWREVSAEISPAGVPWWRRTWFRIAAPVAAAAAVVVMVVQQDSGPGDDAPAVASAPAHADAKAEKAERLVEEKQSAELSAAKDARAAMAEEDEEAPAAFAAADDQLAARSAQADQLERMFAQAEKRSRAILDDSVTTGRGAMRDSLLGTARKGGR